MRKKVSVIMAVYNEKQTVEKAIKGVLSVNITRYEIDLIIVESNSTDGSRDIVSAHSNNPRVNIIFQSQPLGKGNAIREGLRHARGEIILIQDADLEYSFNDYPDVLDPIYYGTTDFVLGSRHGGTKWKVRNFNNQPILSFITNTVHWGLTYIINVLFKVNLTDPFTMYKVFRKDIIANINFVTNRFDFDYEILLKLIRLGHKPVEVPISYSARSFSEGKKVRFFPDPFIWVWTIAKYRVIPKSKFYIK
jgi:glycosyltransferase involved in cell wall biosynthesis